MLRRWLINSQILANYMGLRLVMICVLSLNIVLAGCLDQNQQPPERDRVIYTFDGVDDSGGSPSSATNDVLVKVELIDVIIEKPDGTTVNGGAPDWTIVHLDICRMTDTHPDNCSPGNMWTCGIDASSGRSCLMEEYGATSDAEWSIGEGIVISENQDQICHSACDIQVVISFQELGHEQVYLPVINVT